MHLSKEEVGATAAAAVFGLVVIIGFLTGVTLFESILRAGICAVASSFVGQFLGGIWLKVVKEVKSQEADF